MNRNLRKEALVRRFDADRTEFEFHRTVCDCPECQSFCRYLSGMLIPADLPRLRDALDCRSVVELALKHLAASPGARLLRAEPAVDDQGVPVWTTADGRYRVQMVRDGDREALVAVGGDGRIVGELEATDEIVRPMMPVPVQVPTLVPRRRPDGSCTFLDAAGRCTVHAVAPYGCAFCDGHMSEKEGDAVSLAGLGAIEDDHRIRGPYGMLWMLLSLKGITVDSPGKARSQAAAGRRGGKREPGHTIKVRR
jgi:hypothetical protein